MPGEQWEQRQQQGSGGLQDVQEEPGQGQGSASVLREGQSQGCLQRCLLVDVVILEIKQGSSAEPLEPCPPWLCHGWAGLHSFSTHTPGMAPTLFRVSFVPTALSCLQPPTWQEGWNTPTRAENKG